MEKHSKGHRKAVSPESRSKVLNSKYNELVAQMADETGVDRRAVDALMSKMGLRESLLQRSLEEELTERYRLPREGKSFLSDLRLESLRVASGAVVC